jgi:hypothetical protein
MRTLHTHASRCLDSQVPKLKKRIPGREAIIQVGGLKKPLDSEYICFLAFGKEKLNPDWLMNAENL